jgi:hypothetical protein
VTIEGTGLGGLDTRGASLWRFLKNTFFNETMMGVYVGPFIPYVDESLLKHISGASQLT